MASSRLPALTAYMHRAAHLHSRCVDIAGVSRCKAPKAALLGSTKKFGRSRLVQDVWAILMVCGWRACALNACRILNPEIMQPLPYPAEKA
jgi:hypothetical protein